MLNCKPGTPSLSPASRSAACCFLRRSTRLRTQMTTYHAAVSTQSTTLKKNTIRNTTKTPCRNTQHPYMEIKDHWAHPCSATDWKGKLPKMISKRTRQGLPGTPGRPSPGTCPAASSGSRRRWSAGETSPSRYHSTSGKQDHQNQSYYQH